MSQRQQLERIMEIDRQIRTGLYPTAKKLAESLEVGQRVIFNDRTFMIDRLGAPIAFDRNHNGWYYRDPTYNLPSIMVTEGELLAFFLSVEVARRSLEPTMEKNFLATVEKLAASLKGPITVDLETIRQNYSFASTAITIKNERLLIDIYTAIRDCRQLQIHYYTASRDEWNDRVIDPYHLYNSQGDWYLIAFDHMRSRVRNFLVSRIDHWHTLQGCFQRDPAFNINDWMGQAFQTERGEGPVQIMIRFDPYQARYIRERIWHETQELEDLPDGGVILKFTSGGLYEVQRWVMQYGSHAEVLEPVGLRQAVLADVMRTAEIYRRCTENESNVNKH